MKPKGKLLIIGGAEYKGDVEDSLYVKERSKEYNRLEILRELIHSHKQRKIEVITSGSQIVNLVKQDYQRAFRKLGYPNPGFLDIKDKIEARDKKYIHRVEEAGAILFTGGDQFRLATIIGGTKILDIIKHKYLDEKDFIIAGTSAGAMVMPEIMITEGGTEEALIDRDLKTSSGLSILRDCIIDTHFIKRGRFGRLAHAVIINPDHLGIGLGEDTALIIKNGSDAECRGSGMVVIIDGKNIRQTNMTEASEGDPVFVENLKVHILVKGCRFSVKTRRLLNPTINIKSPKN